MGYLIAGAILLYFLVLIYLAFKTIDGAGIGFGIATFAWCVFGLGFFITAEHEKSEVGPCIEWATSVALVGKVATPYRYCVNRGEWLKEE